MSMIKQAYDAGCHDALVEFGIVAGEKVAKAGLFNRFMRGAQETAENIGEGGFSNWMRQPLDSFSKARSTSARRLGAAGRDTWGALGDDAMKAMKANKVQTGLAAGAAGLGGAGLVGAGYAMGSPPEQSRMDHLRGLFTG